MIILFKYYADVENCESYNNNNNNNNIQIIIIDIYIYIDKSKIQKIEMNFNPLKRYNLYFRKKNPYETSPKAQQFFNALYHFHKPYLFKVACRKI